MRARVSRSISANWPSVMSPSSSCICASSSCSRRPLSSCDSASAAATILSSTNRRLPISNESRMNTSRAFELEPDVDEVVGRPGPGVLEGQLVEAARDCLPFGVGPLLLVAGDQERGVHDHLVADRLVDARRHRHFAELVEDVRDVALRPRLQRRFDQAAVLHAREVGRTFLPGNLLLQAADVLVLALDFADRLIASPEHLEAELELLRSAAEAFGDVLNKMQNKLEFGLKVLWDRDQAVREVEAEDEDINRLKKEISGQKGPTYFARMQYGRLVDAALHARSERYVAAVLEELRDVSVASRINKPIGDKMIMNAAFLISRDQEAAFDAKVKAIAGKFERLTFTYTGPWPPYN